MDAHDLIYGPRSIVNQTSRKLQGPCPWNLEAFQASSPHHLWGTPKEYFDAQIIDDLCFITSRSWSHEPGKCQCLVLLSIKFISFSRETCLIKPSKNTHYLGALEGEAAAWSTRAWITHLPRSAALLTWRMSRASSSDHLKSQTTSERKKPRSSVVDQAKAGVRMDVQAQIHNIIVYYQQGDRIKSGGISILVKVISTTT